MQDTDDRNEPSTPLSFDERMQWQRLKQDYQGRAHRDVITGRLALILLCIMGGTICVHYIVVAVFAAQGNTEVLDSLRNIFNAWLPVISGLAGAAVAYYFANSNK